VRREADGDRRPRRLRQTLRHAVFVGSMAVSNRRASYSIGSLRSSCRGHIALQLLSPTVARAILIRGDNKLPAAG